MPCLFLCSLPDEHPKRDGVASLQTNHCQVLAEAIDLDGAFPVGTRDRDQLVRHDLELGIVQLGKIQGVGGSRARRGSRIARILVLGGGAKDVNEIAVVQIDLELLG